MEIINRQFGQIEAACFALEEATEKNNTALRLVQELPKGLACPHAKGEPGPVGQVEPVEPVCAALRRGKPVAAKALEGKRPDEIRLYGQELINQGATMKELIKMVMEHFSLTQDAFAHLIKVNQGSLSKYLRNGERHDAVITGVTEFFGDDGAAIKENN